MIDMVSITMHYHVNPIIMSTTHNQAVGKCNSELTGATLSGAKPCIFSGKTASVVAE
mgnify:CR=1 FL=1